MEFTTYKTLEIWIKAPNEEYRSVGATLKPKSKLTDDEREEASTMDVEPLIQNAIWKIAAWETSSIYGDKVKMVYEDVDKIPYTMKSFKKFLQALEDCFKTKPFIELTDSPDNEWHCSDMIIPNEILELLEKK